MSIFQELHDSEINATISSFFDGCWGWKLGDEMNGFKDEGQALSFAAAEKELAEAACRHFPNSVFAKAQRTMEDA